MNLLKLNAFAILYELYGLQMKIFAVVIEQIQPMSKLPFIIPALFK